MKSKHNTEERKKKSHVSSKNETKTEHENQYTKNNTTHETDKEWFCGEFQIRGRL